jgi:hypothetical protein
MNPQFPIYIVSKGRADSRMTVKVLESMGVPFHIVVEEQERAAYAAVIARPRFSFSIPTTRSDMTRSTRSGIARAADRGRRATSHGITPSLPALRGIG